LYKVQLDQFEGPLDLLLYFIRRDEIDIYDIPIAKITSEYLQIIEGMKSMNLSVAGEFILMAATLMRIKSKMLLPRPELDDEGKPIDPRTELVQQLVEYHRFKDVSSELSLKLHDQSYRHERSGFQEIDEMGDVGVYFKKVSLFDLAQYFKEAMDRMPVITAYELRREPISLDDKKHFILKSFDGDGTLTFSRLLSSCKDKQEIIITFLSVLDLMRLLEIVIYQNNLFGDIEIHRLEKN
jgi:segregation and condensation protein A|tara:strand:- start:1667 stop:2383 length:717 start_codon:yes stop_codon:yes gene_type:complete